MIEKAEKVLALPNEEEDERNAQVGLGGAFCIAESYS